MEKRQYATLIRDKWTGREEQEVETNEHVRGRIMGYSEILCDENSITWNFDGKRYLYAECAEKSYDVFKRKVEEHYRDLCEFDCDAPKVPKVKRKN